MVQEKKACYVCLKPGHISKKCKASVRCQVCEKKHYVAMCPDVPKGKCEAEKKTHTDGTVLSNQTRSTEVMLQTLLVRVNGSSGSRILRALLDSGSQKSFLSEKASKVLGLKWEDEVTIAHSLFGGGQTQPKRHRVLNIQVENMNNNYSCLLSVLDQPVICGKISRVQDHLLIDELKRVGVELTDFGDGQPDVNLLLGADVLGKLYTGRIHPTKCGPVAVETKLGWTVMGKLSQGLTKSDSTSLVFSMISTDAQIANLWSLDSMGIKDSTETKSRHDLEEAAMEYFEHSTTRLADGRFEVSLPWVEGHPVMSSNEELAVRRLVSCTKKLEELGRFNDYQNVFDDWLANGVIEEVPANELSTSGHYLPHRAVIKESSETTKVRPVFDASAKSKGEASLNECLEKGRNLLELIPKIISGFRWHRIGLISDIEKAFLQISVKKEERDFLRFLWWEKEAKIVKKYRHCRVVFGVSSSPFLLAATLRMLLENVTEERQEVASHLLKSLYVDNCVTSLSCMSDIQNFIVDCVQMMNEGQFNLRGWIWNDEAQPEKFISVLGLLWNVKKDELSLDLRDIPCDEKEGITKRKVLSLAHRLFDPIGFSSPVSLFPKMLLQEAWKLKIGWDKELPEHLSTKFLKWSKELPLLKEVCIPRWVFDEEKDKCRVSLHVFTDASKDAYAAVVFIRSESKVGVSIQLLQAKSRVAPVNAVTIPRLELLGCCIGSRLAATVRIDLDLPEVNSYYWTDSSNALCWIQRHDNWATFVGNRVKEIRELTDPKCWRHIQGSLNPADLPSRGCSPKQLLQSRWWEGPTWLKNSPEFWPKSEVNGDEDIVGSERKKTVASHLVVKAKIPWYASYFSNYSRIVRMLAWIQRYFHNLKNKCNKLTGDLKEGELLKSELWLIRLVQKETFADCESKLQGPLKQLNAEKDENGIWRLKTKIFRRNDTGLFRCPMVLPSDHMVARLLIQKVHEALSHGGVQLVMCAIREKFWLTKARKSIKQAVSECKICKRFNSKKLESVPTPLPLNRVKDAAVFEVVGVDLAGPLYLKDRQKGWVVLFTCAVYRAVHFELISSLSTECFLQSLRRFIGRRGRPSKIYSDNGTNFVGAANSWMQVDWEKIRGSGFGSSHSLQPIEWIFNPPSAPWWGGWWERIVRLLKEVLRKILGRACLCFEEMMTVLCDCESVINSRPLTYLSEDAEDLAPLTPSMLLQEIREVGIPEVDTLDAQALNKRVVYRQKIRADFRQRFRSEYLGMLQPDKRKRIVGEAIKPGDVVLVGSDNVKRLNWPMARVLEVFPGKDGVIRVAKVKTANGEIVRPIQRLYSFEVSEADRGQLVSVPAEVIEVSEADRIEMVSVPPEVTEESVGEKADDLTPGTKMSRAGRRIKAPKRFE